jgi:hypothetical protein
MVLDQLTLFGVDEEDFLLGAPDSMPVDGEAAPGVDEQDEDSMAIDEEGRPRFAPSRDIVSLQPTLYDQSRVAMS